MIRALLFSRDRALQLDACLRSFARHVADAEAAKIHVLYCASSESLQRQYEELASLYAGNVVFSPEVSFRSQVLEILGETGAHRARKDSRFGLRSLLQPARKRSVDHADDLVLFLVDDTLFVRTIRLAMIEAVLQANTDALGFSLRLGRNTVENYTLNRLQQLPKFQPAGPGLLRYEWAKADGDFSYPLEISSSVYRLHEVTRLVSRFGFRDPNTLESALSLRARGFARRRPAMLCPEYSVAFCAPLNRVQRVFDNRAGEAPEMSPGRLADKFDEGFRIDVAALDGFVPSGCHQEVELSFEPRTAPPASS